MNMISMSMDTYLFLAVEGLGTVRALLTSSRANKDPMASGRHLISRIQALWLGVLCSPTAVRTIVLGPNRRGSLNLSAVCLFLSTMKGWPVRDLRHVIMLPSMPGFWPTRRSKNSTGFMRGGIKNAGHGWVLGGVLSFLGFLFSVFSEFWGFAAVLGSILSLPAPEGSLLESSTFGWGLLITGLLVLVFVGIFGALKV